MADRRIAFVGTPDAANLGDLLFPLIAERELGDRLGGVELVRYGYQAFGDATWPYPVRPLGALADEIGDFELVLLGGGYLIRGDTAVAENYLPSDRRAHEPLSLWLLPTLLAHAAGIPVAWNAVGVAGTQIETWLAPLIQAAVDGAAYIAVRNRRSAEALECHLPGARVHVVPDTVFGVEVLLDDRARQAARDQLAAAGIEQRGYVVLQATRHLELVRDAVDSALQVARERELAVLELPIGPIIGDRANGFAASGRVARLPDWPPPEVLAALIAGSQGVIHTAFHAGVVGFATGVPCLAGPMLPGKLEVLDSLPGVHVLGVNGASAAVGRRSEDAAADAVRRSQRSALQAHWDRIAGLVGTRPARPNPGLAQLLADLPARLASQTAELEALRLRLAGTEEFAAAYRAFAERTTELEQELETRLASPADLEAELARLRMREQTLEQILAGGWWRLRGRLTPLRRLLGARD